MTPELATVEALEIERPTLYHYSRDIVTAVRSSDVSKRGCGAYKPAGFWVSVDEPEADGKPYGWPAWCEAESYSLDDLTKRHQVHLLDPERLLWITTSDDLLWFHKTFGKQGHYDIEIDWPLVANQFAGLIIAPYQWGRRFDIHWYYGWDCASGVIWDASIVGRITVDEDIQNDRN